MSTEIVRWQDTPRIFVVEASDPKRKGLPKRKGWLDIGQRQSVAVMDAAVKDYGSRTGYAVVPCFPHTLPESFKPKAKRAQGPQDGQAQGHQGHHAGLIIPATLYLQNI